MKFIFIANAALGDGLSGSDRIFIELARRWSGQHTVQVAVWEEGYRMCQREQLTSVEYVRWFIGRAKNLPFAINYFYRVASGIYYALSEKYNLDNQSYIYSCSDFWQDAFPSLVLKARYPQAKLIGSFYLAAPNPFKGFNEHGALKLPTLKGIIYYLLQLPVYYLFKWYADYIFVTSQPDTKRFPKQEKAGKAIIVRGGVDTQKVIEWKDKIGNVEKLYDAVFLGRFHPQKGVLELIDIWKKVTAVRPGAKLIMLGDGPQMADVKDKIARLGLQNNVIVKGYTFDGEEKYRIFLQSRIVVHPAVYDSGGMAAAEAMVWGLPGVSFDLEALKTYYPKGMIKTSVNNLDEFAANILSLLTDAQLYEKTSKQASDLIQEQWSWDNRASEIISYL